MHLRTADALHLAIVLRVGCPLATFDVVLAAAAKAEGVDVIA
jgi:predicted nucleic acid-binding protein